MVFPSNPMGPPGMMPGRGMPMPGLPFPPRPMPPMFGGIPGANPFAGPPMAMGIPGLPPGMSPMPGPMGMPAPIDPFTGRPLNLGMGPVPMPPPMPLPMPMPMGMPPQAAGPAAPLVSMFNSLLGTLQSTQQPQQPENPLMTVFNTLMSSLSGILGLPDPQGGSVGAQAADTATAISDPATALTSVISEASDIASADGDAGSVSTADLAIVARNKDGKYSADAQAAAQFLMANQAIWAAIDKLDNNADTKASIQNLSKALADANIMNATADNPPEDTSTDNTETTTVDDPATALTSLIGEAKDIADADDDASSISVQDLVIVAKNEDDDFSPEAQAAAKFMLAHQKLWSQIDAMDDTEDTKVTLENLSKAISDPDILGSSDDTSSSTSGEAFTISDNATALDILDQSFADIAKLDGDASSVSLLDLSRAARKSNNKELLAVVKYLQSNPDIFKQLAGKDGKADSVSEADIASALGDTNFMSTTPEEAAAQNPDNMALKDILSTLNDNKDTVDTAVNATADKLIAKQDLQAIADNTGGKYSSKLVAAAKAALKNDALMKSLFGSDMSGTSTLDDLSQFATQAQNDPNFTPKPPVENAQEAFKVISDNLSVFQTDSNDKLISYDDLLLALNSSDSKYTPEIKKAVQWIINDKNKERTDGSKSAFDAGDALDNTTDNVIQVDVIQSFALKGILENQFGITVAKQLDDATWQKVYALLTANDNALLKKLDIAADGGSADGVIGNGDMKAALADTSGKFTAEEKQAIMALCGGSDGNDLGGSTWDDINDDDSKASYEEFRKDMW